MSKITKTKFQVLYCSYKWKVNGPFDKTNGTQMYSYEEELSKHYSTGPKPQIRKQINSKVNLEQI